MTSTSLLALGIPPNCVLVQDDSNYQQLFRHLEEDVFRQTYGQSRNFLYTQDFQEFLDQLPKYLDNLKCPVKLDDRESVLNWILEAAIDKMNDIQGADIINSKSVKSFMDEHEEINRLQNVLNENLQINSPEFRSQLKQVLSSVGLEKLDHPDTFTLLKALVIFVETAVASGNYKPESTNILNLDDLSITKASKGDKKLDYALKTLHLLNVDQFRSLQTKINELIVQIQKVTADPKTDLNLGKRGR